MASASYKKKMHSHKERITFHVVLSEPLISSNTIGKSSILKAVTDILHLLITGALEDSLDSSNLGLKQKGLSAV